MLTSLHIINLWCAGRVDEAQAQFDEFADTVEEYPEEAVLRLELAKSAERLISAYSEAGRIEDARAMFGYLGELAAAHPEDAGIRLRFAEGAFTLISADDNAGRLQDARTVANTARDALLSGEFAALLRKQFDEEDAEQSLSRLRSLLNH